MPTYDPIESALDAIVAHFTAAFAAADPVVAVAVSKGWPDGDTTLDLDTSPVLTVSAVGNVEEEACSPTDVVVDGSTVTYRVGYLTIRAQLDLWCRSRAQREDNGPAIIAALNNQIPATSGLWIDSTNYHNRPLSIEATGGRFFDDATAPADIGEWRRSWDLAVYTDQVIVVEHPTQDVIEVHATVDDGAAETITIVPE